MTIALRSSPMVAVAASSAAASPPQIRHRVGHCTHIRLRPYTVQKIGPAYSFLPYPYRTLTVCPYTGTLLSYHVSGRGSKLYESFKSVILSTINSIEIKSTLDFTYLYMNCTIGPPMVLTVQWRDLQYTAIYMPYMGYGSKP
jgi:hypothetical protein